MRILDVNEERAVIECASEKERDAYAEAFAGCGVERTNVLDLVIENDPRTYDLRRGLERFAAHLAQSKAPWADDPECNACGAEAGEPCRQAECYDDPADFEACTKAGDE